MKHEIKPKMATVNAPILDLAAHIFNIVFHWSKLSLLNFCSSEEYCESLKVFRTCLSGLVKSLFTVVGLAS